MTVARTDTIPCTVITGALGSGKTTLIRTLMEREEMAGTALIVNEFGEVGLDHLLVASSVETTLLMDNGCMCCSLRGDVVDTVLALFGAVERGEMPAFRRILIETTGLADPVPIVRDLSTAAPLRDRLHVRNVITCVDGLIGRGQLSGDPVAVAQVAQADICLVTKADLADPLALDQLTETLAAINPLVSVLRISEDDVPDSEALLRAGSGMPAESSGGGHGHHHDHGAPHAGIESWSTEFSEALPWPRVRDWIDLVYSLHAARMLRMKALLWIEERDQPLLVQAVGPVVTPLRLLDQWPENRKASRIVMISKGLRPAILRRSFDRDVLRSA